MMKRFFVLIAVILLIIFSIVGVGFLKHKELDNIEVTRENSREIENIKKKILK